MEMEGSRRSLFMLSDVACYAMYDAALLGGSDADVFGSDELEFLLSMCGSQEEGATQVLPFTPE